MLCLPKVLIRRKASIFESRKCYSNKHKKTATAFHISFFLYKW